MKNLIKTFVAASLGGLITIGAYEAFDNDSKGFLDNEQTSVINYNAKPANYVVNDEVSTNVDFSAAAELVTPTVVHIKSQYTPSGRSQMQQIPLPFRDFFGEDFFGGGRRMQPQPRMASGSGVIISEDGYIVTNNHVIENASEIEVSLNDSRTYKAQVMGTDPLTDLALIKIEEEGLPAIAVGNSDAIKVGQWVMAVGNPFNLESTVTAGIVSAKGRNIGILNGDGAIESFIQTDAAVNPGNSGGALVNLNGELIGINTAIASPTGSYSGYSFAVPSNMMLKVVEDLMKYGNVQRAYLGVRIQGINSQFAEQKGLDVIRGAYVADLTENGAARQAGIQVGDVIVKVDDKVINTASQLQVSIGAHRPGDKVDVTVNRDGEQITLEVPLTNLEGNAEIVRAEKSEISRMLGAEFEEVSGEEAQELGIDGGVRVSKLVPGALSAQTKIQEGFIITRANKEDIDSIEELMGIVKSQNGGVLLEGIYPGNPGIYYYGFGLNY